MHHRRTPNSRLAPYAGPAALALALALATGGAWAEANPYYFGASQSFTHDSNVTRASDGSPAKTSATISSTALIAGIDQPIGRQRLRANARVQHNVFDGYKEFNNTGYGMEAALDWETIGRISGIARLRADQVLYQPTPDANSSGVTQRNLQRSTNAYLLGRIGVVTPLTLEGSLEHRTLRYSLDSSAKDEFDQDIVGLGARYRLSGALTVGAGVRHSQADYPRGLRNLAGAFVAEQLKRDDLDLTADLALSGASTITARISGSRWKYRESTSSNFSGATGLISWGWRPTGKLTFNTQLSRESGIETLFYNTGLINVDTGGYLVQPFDASRLTSALQLQADYQASAKIRVTANARLVERSYALLNNFVLGESVSDRAQQLSLGAVWSPLRWLRVNCDVGTQRRSSIETSVGTIQPVNVNTFGCGAQAVLQ